MTFVDNMLDARWGTIRGRALVPNPKGFITPGLFGRMRLLGSGAYTALLVPDSSIVTDQTRRIAMVVEPGGTVAPRVIEVGPTVDGLRIVRSGLKPSDQVIIAGLQRVRPGEKAAPRRGRIVPTAPGQAPSPDAAYAAPPAALATSAR
jgi:RND family efflux transporter MFP subunit